MKNFKLITISLLAIAMSSTSCTKSDKTKAQSSDAKIPVKIAQVSEKNVPQIVEYPATVQRFLQCRSRGRTGCHH